MKQGSPHTLRLLLSMAMAADMQRMSTPVSATQMHRNSRRMKIGQAHVQNHRGRGLRRKLRAKKAWG